jgi:hypothetical protein
MHAAQNNQRLLVEYGITHRTTGMLYFCMNYPVVFPLVHRFVAAPPYHRQSAQKRAPLALPTTEVTHPATVETTLGPNS